MRKRRLKDKISKKIPLQVTSVQQKMTTAPAKKKSLQLAMLIVGGCLFRFPHTCWKQKKVGHRTPSLKLTASLHRKMDGWNTVLGNPFWGPFAYCQVRPLFASTKT